MKKYIYIFVAILFTSCFSEDFPLDVTGMFSASGEPVDVRFAQSKAYNDSVGEVHIAMPAEDYTVYVCSDSHITRKSHKNLDYFIDQYNNAPSPKLAIHLGDLIDAQKNYPCADSVLNLANDYLFITPGNHDVYFHQWPVYRSFYHSGVYWFDTRYGDTLLELYICLDTADGTVGVEQLKWLRELLASKSQAGYRRIIVFTHTHFWKLDGSQGHTSNYGMEETYELTALFAQYGVEFVWTGHQHARQSVIYKGVNYLVLDATKDSEKGQSFMTVEMGKSAIYHYLDYPKL